MRLPTDFTTGDHTLTVYVEDYVEGRDASKTKKSTKVLNFAYDNDNPTASVDALSSTFQPKETGITGTASDASGIAKVVGTLYKNNVKVEGVAVNAVVTPKNGSSTDYTWSANVTIDNPDEAATYKWIFTSTDNYGKKW